MQVIEDLLLIDIIVRLDGGGVEGEVMVMGHVCCGVDDLGGCGGG